MIKDFLQVLKEYAMRDKKMSILILVIWLVVTITIGIVIGIKSRVAVVTLTPEEENIKAMKVIKDDREKIDNGTILTPKNNLSVNQIELSRDYTLKVKRNSRL